MHWTRFMWQDLYRHYWPAGAAQLHSSISSCLWADINRCS